MITGSKDINKTLRKIRRIDRQILEISQKASERIQLLETEKEVEVEELKKFSLKNRALLFKDSKSVEFPLGKFGFKSSKKIEINEATTLSLIKSKFSKEEIESMGLISITESVSKRALFSFNSELLKSIDAKKIENENFYVTLEVVNGN